MRHPMIAALAALAMIPAAANAAPPKGVWTNPKKNVRVTFQRCGDAMCGKVIWASPEAQEKAGSPLVGTMLFEDFVEEGPGEWSGSVFVPDIGQSVSGTIRQMDANTLVGEGCVIAGLGCKSQTWTRLR
ncbi:DUF2147 domain-containing protein [Sphingomonas aliaeris]|uniref:DUF2147 domain-containing protein n=1 Tax=Sphingomonas aliaeris TaxID=2759526 RepID=UPI001CED7E0E|nr:DUF2147 domain-containing protein [Sphingomonas aliaeris]